jgi:hypothetical protein
MKKTFVIILTLILVLAAVSCAGKTSGSSASPPASDAAAVTGGAVLPFDSAATAAETTPDEPGVVRLEGTIGGLPVQMRIKIEDGDVTGSYSYDKVGQNIRLEGTIEANRMLTMKEYGEDGDVTGSFDCWYAPGIRLTGTWTDAGGEKTLEVKLDVLDGIPADAVWAGEWYRQDGGMFDSATLVIFNEAKTQFSFQFDAFNGANTGLLSGTAVISGSSAVYTDTSTGAVVQFTLKDDSINVDANNDANMQAGMGVGYGGIFVRERKERNDTLLSLGYVTTQAQDDAFRAMTGADYEQFLSSAHLRYDGEDLDGLGATVYTWMVRGLHGYSDSIVMFMPDGTMCAAVIDLGDNTIKVYTNSPKITDTPKTIRAWAEDFPDYQLVFVGSAKS